MKRGPMVRLPRAPPVRAIAKAVARKTGTTVSDVLGSLGSSIGGMVAPGIGSVAGRFIGRGAGDLFGRVFGRGDYVVEQNTLKTGPPPVFGQQQVRLTNREYLGEVNGSILFANATYPINPGDSMTFPWLSRIAALFQQYEMNGLVFEFVSTSANALNSTNTALGKVILATNYNAAESSFTDQRSALITQYSNYGKPADCLLHPIECKRSHTPVELLYVRVGPPIAGSDIRLYDLGNFQIMTEGMQAIADIGALWVSYDVTLIKPVLATQGGTIPSQLWSLPGQSGGSFAGAVDLGPSQVEVPVVLESVNLLNSAIVFNTNDVGGVYDIQVSGTVLTAQPIPKLIATYSNCVDLIPDGSIAKPVGVGLTFYTIPSTATTFGSWFAHMQVRLNGTSLVSFPTILLTQNIAYPNGSTGQVFITQINSNAPLTPLLQVVTPPGYLVYKDSYRAPKKRIEHPQSIIPDYKQMVDVKTEVLTDEEVYLDREVRRSPHKSLPEVAISSSSSSSSSSSASGSRSSSQSRERRSLKLPVLE